MSRPLIVLLAIVHAAIAIDQGYKGNYPLAFVYSCYGLAYAGWWFTL